MEFVTTGDSRQLARCRVKSLDQRLIVSLCYRRCCCCLVSVKTAANDARKTARLACAVSHNPLAMDILRLASTALASTNSTSEQLQNRRWIRLARNKGRSPSPYLGSL
jgi:hypothetical protein